MKGVQTFDYRGSTRHSNKGQMVILHPDEIHDGRAGTGEGFQYRSFNLSPASVQNVLCGKPLPYIKGGTSSDDRLLRTLIPVLGNLQHELNDFEYEDILFEISTELHRLSSTTELGSISNYAACCKAREIILDSLGEDLSLSCLAETVDHDRWQLSRDFRLSFGTSPYRYRTLRRLEQARKMMLSGMSVTAAAFDCGFSDQSHFGRQFKKTYGITPKGWLSTIRH